MFGFQLCFTQLTTESSELCSETGLKARKRDHVQPLLQALHWLPAQDRIDYKLKYLSQILLTHPQPISLAFPLCSPSRKLRSSADTGILRTPLVRTKAFGQRCFSHCASNKWNSLPSDIRHIQSSHAFKTALKTNLCKHYHDR